MKLKHLASFVFVLACSLGASAWNCPAGQIRQQAPAGTPTTAPYYDVVEGIAFICVPTPTPTTPTVTPTSVTNSNQNSSSATSTSGANAGATATGGNQKQNQSQGQSQSSTSSASNAGNNSSYSSSDVYNQVRQAPLAYAPTIIPSNCQGSLSGGVSAPVGGISLGGSRADKNCQRLALAAAFAAMRNFAAAAKVLCSTDGAKTAHLTIADCQATFEEPAARIQFVPVPTPAVVPTPVQPQIILIEPPITVTAPAEPRARIVKPRAVVKKKPVVCPDSLKTPMEK